MDLFLESENNGHAVLKFIANKLSLLEDAEPSEAVLKERKLLNHAREVIERTMARTKSRLPKFLARQSHVEEKRRQCTELDNKILSLSALKNDTEADLSRIQRNIAKKSAQLQKVEKETLFMQERIKSLEKNYDDLDSDQLAKESVAQGLRVKIEEVAAQTLYEKKSLAIVLHENEVLSQTLVARRESNERTKEKIQELDTRIEGSEGELEREEKQQKNGMKKTSEVRAEIKELERRFKEERVVLSLEKAKGVSLESKRETLKASVEDYLGRYERMFSAVNMISREINKKKLDCEKIESTNEELGKSDEQLGSLCEDATVELGKLGKINEKISKAIEKVQNEVNELSKTKDLMNQECLDMKSSLNTRESKLEKVKKKLYSLSSEFEVLKSSVENKEGGVKVTEDAIAVYTNACTNLDLELAECRKQGLRDREQIELVMSEIEKINENVFVVNSESLSKFETRRQVDRKVLHLQKVLQESGMKLKKQQNLYENVKNERNTNAKNLIENQELIENLNRKLRIMNQNFAKMTEELIIRQQSLDVSRGQLQKVEGEVSELTNGLSNVKEKILVCIKSKELQEVKNKKLGELISEMHEELSRHDRDWKSFTRERDILQKKLIRRRDDVAKLYASLQVHQANVRKNNDAIDGSQKEAKALQAECKRLGEAHDLLIERLEEKPKMQKELGRLQRELLLEEVKKRALEDETDLTINFHELRTLETTDPERFEGIRNAQRLRKRLVEFNEDISKVKILMEEKKQEFIKVRELLNERATINFEEQINYYLKAMQEREKDTLKAKQELKTIMKEIRYRKHELCDARNESKAVEVRFIQNKVREVDGEIREKLVSMKQDLEAEDEREINELFIQGDMSPLNLSSDSGLSEFEMKEEKIKK